VSNSQNHRRSGLCPSPRILITRRQRFGNWICFRPQMIQRRHPVGPLRKSQPHSEESSHHITKTIHAPGNRVRQKDATRKCTIIHCGEANAESNYNTKGRDNCENCQFPLRYSSILTASII
jgi:hypothetical protein